MPKSTYLNDAVLNWHRGIVFPTVPATVYYALFTTDPTDTGTGAEVSGGAYARVAVPTATGSFSAPAADGQGGRSYSNAVAITFPTPTANWGTVTHFGIFSAATGGNLLRHGLITTSRNILSGDQSPTFAIGALVSSEA